MTSPDRCDNEREDHKRAIADEWASRGVKGALSLLALPYRKEGNSYLIHCPWHDEKTPSTNVRIGGFGTLQAHCFGGCGTHDVFSLVAKVYGLDVKTDFPKVIDLAGSLVGIGELRDYTPRTAPRPVPIVEAPKYPPPDEVAELLRSCSLCDNDGEARAWLASRGLDARRVDLRTLAYALPLVGALPSWARYKGNWSDSGYRVIFPLFDAAGKLQSVRAGTVKPKDQIAKGELKRLATAGFSSKGLVLACELGREVLRGGEWPTWHNGPARIVISEGEPDWMAWATRESLRVEDNAGGMQQWACFGVYSGGWTKDHGARIPKGAIVSVRTDLDDAGRKFAQEIKATLPHCDVRKKVS